MNSVNKLGIIVASITVALLIVGYGAYWGIRALFLSQPEENLTQEVTNSQENSPNISSEDSDNDGLPDLVENLYRTDPQNPDTDGDGIIDGDEIALGKDPTIPGPDDKLQDIPSGVVALPSDTYTKKYMATLPANLERNQVLNKERLQAFIEQQKGPALPEVTISTSVAAGKEAITAYLNSISSSTNPALKPVTSADIEQAYREHYANPKDSTALPALLISLQQNVDTLKTISAPQEAAAIHTKLVSASQALADNVTLLKNVNTDFVGSLIGAKKIEELGPVFSSLATDIAALEAKYGIE